MQLKAGDSQREMMTASYAVSKFGTAHLGAVFQAVMYFRRALKLDRHYLSAWTLMGHEYVEMKNTSAAIGELCMQLTW